MLTTAFIGCRLPGSAPGHQPRATSTSPSMNASRARRCAAVPSSRPGTSSNRGAAQHSRDGLQSSANTPQAIAR
jgi:hypothetical protein